MIIVSRVSRGGSALLVIDNQTKEGREEGRCTLREIFDTIFRGRERNESGLFASPPQAVESVSERRIKGSFSEMTRGPG